MAKRARRKRGFRNSVVVTFAAAAAAGCAQSSPGQDGSGIDNQTPTFMTTNPPPTAFPTLAAGSGAAGVAGGIAGGQASVAGAPPPIPLPGKPIGMCPTMPPSTGEPCATDQNLMCRYGPNAPCAPMRTLFVRCEVGTWLVTDATPTCNPPPPPVPDEDAGA
jgi:hypothetical protein